MLRSRSGFETVTAPSRSRARAPPLERTVVPEQERDRRLSASTSLHPPATEPVRVEHRLLPRMTPGRCATRSGGQQIAGTAVCRCHAGCAQPATACETRLPRAAPRAPHRQPAPRSSPPAREESFHRARLRGCRGRRGRRRGVDRIGTPEIDECAHDTAQPSRRVLPRRGGVFFFAITPRASSHWRTARRTCSDGCTPSSARPFRVPRSIPRPGGMRPPAAAESCGRQWICLVKRRVPPRVRRPIGAPHGFGVAGSVFT
jgi:hypothetical protein